MADERARDGRDVAGHALRGAGDLPGDLDGLGGLGQAAVKLAVKQLEQLLAALLPLRGRGDGAAVGHGEERRHGGFCAGLGLVVVGVVGVVGRAAARAGPQRPGDAELLFHELVVVVVAEGAGVGAARALGGGEVGGQEEQQGGEPGEREALG